jgi:hypothetical protein
MRAHMRTFVTRCARRMTGLARNARRETLPTSQGSEGRSRAEPLAGYYHTAGTCGFSSTTARL